MLPKQQYHKNYSFGTARLGKLGIFLARSTTDPKPEAINPKLEPSDRIKTCTYWVFFQSTALKGTR